MSKEGYIPEYEWDGNKILIKKRREIVEEQKEEIKSRESSPDMPPLETVTEIYGVPVAMTECTHTIGKVDNEMRETVYTNYLSEVDVDPYSIVVFSSKPIDSTSLVSYLGKYGTIEACRGTENELTVTFRNVESANSVMQLGSFVLHKKPLGVMKKEIRKQSTKEEFIHTIKHQTKEQKPFWWFW